MAQRKETPKMIYPKSALFWECKCRLCDGIIDKTYRNNLFLELAK
jgi:dUTPase